LSGFTAEAFRFLEALEANNDRAWFKANQATFEAALRAPFAATLQAISTRLAGTSVPFAGGAETMFRLQRDIRFSRDKTPYKTHVSGLLTRHGAKDEDGSLVYLHLDRTGGFAAAGRYMPATDALARIRDRIVAAPAALERMLAALEGNGLALGQGDRLKAMPRGYSEAADAWYADHLKLKSWMVRHALEPADWLEDRIAGEVADFAVRAAPLLDFLDDAVDRGGAPGR